jgi:hypothetical protein
MGVRKERLPRIRTNAAESGPSKAQSEAEPKLENLEQGKKERDGAMPAAANPPLTYCLGRAERHRNGPDLGPPRAGSPDPGGGEAVGASE